MVGDVDGPGTHLKTHHSSRNKRYSIERKYEMDAVQNDEYHVKFSIGEASRGNVKEGEALESSGLEARKDLLIFFLISSLERFVMDGNYINVEVDG